MEKVSIILSILAIVGSLYTYFNHDRKIKKQEKLINKHVLKKYELEEEAKLKAHIKGNITSMPRRRRLFTVCNAGKAVAFNIRIEPLSDMEGIICSDFDSYEMLNPQERFERTLHLAEGSSPTLKVKFVWNDQFAQDNEYTQVLDLK